MSYSLPDEPRLGIRGNPAVDGIWPLLAVMLTGPLLGFIWLSFNAWALGCRNALGQTLAALAALIVYVLSVLLFFIRYPAILGPIAGDKAWLVASLMLVVVQALLLALAYWMVLAQRDARDWQVTYGQAPRNGLLPLLGLFALGWYARAQYGLLVVFGIGWVVLQ